MRAAREAINWLTSRIRSPRHVVNELHISCQLAVVLDLAAHYFPGKIHNRKIRFFDRETIATVLHEFLTLVDRHLFPTYGGDLDFDEEGIERALCAIPVAPVGTDWWEWEPRDLARIEQAVLVGCGVLSSAGQWLERDGPLGLVPALNFQLLTSACRRESAPLPLLPSAARLVGHCTGSSFLDISQEEYGMAGCEDPWCRQAVDGWRKDWERAQPFIKATRQLEDWLRPKGDGPVAGKRFDKVVELVGRAVQQRVKVKVNV